MVKYDYFTGKTTVAENYKYYSNTETDKANEKSTAGNSVYYYNLSVENYPYYINWLPSISYKIVELFLPRY